MSGVYGHNINFAIFGESHGPAIGGVISSLPAGLDIDFDAIDHDLKRRNHRAIYSTSRAEADKYEILSGVLEGKVTGAPLAFIIRNADTKSGDYSQLKELMRPGHSDYPAYIKYNGCNDVRGGGHFSGRLTAPLVFAGSLARQYLKQKGIGVFSHIISVGSVKGESLINNLPSQDKINELQNMEMPVMSDKLKSAFMEEIEKHRNDCNSIGGVIECCLYGIPAGIGSPFFDSVESRLSAMMFSIPAVKGIEFGVGFGITEMTGFDANDKYEYNGKKVVAKTNNNGGILGGITNGAPIVFKTAIKPTPSVSLEQETVDLKERCNTTVDVKGRHDSCIVPRAVPVIEAAAALVILDIVRGGK